MARGIVHMEIMDMAKERTEEVHIMKIKVCTEILAAGKVHTAMAKEKAPMEKE